jgi:hypothetical protein
MVENYGNYRFRYCRDVDKPSQVRIYIVAQPSYRGRADDCHSSHRLWSGGGAPPHICIKASQQPTTLYQAQELAHRWARATDSYIRTGRFS